MKKILLLLALASLSFGTANAQFGKLKDKIKKPKSTRIVKGSANDPSRIKKQAPLDEIWKPEVELITDVSKITDAYLKKVEKMGDWVDRGRLSNLEVRHIVNNIKRVAVLARYARGKGNYPRGSRCDFAIKDSEIIRFEAINRGKQPSVDGNEYHVLGFTSQYSVDDETYNTPLHKLLREEIFPAAIALRDYTLKKMDTSFKYVKIHEEYGGNMPMCADKDGNAVRCASL